MNREGKAFVTKPVKKSQRLPPVASKRKKIFNLNNNTIQKSLDTSVKDRLVPISESIEEIAEMRLRAPKGINCGTVVIRFNHYKKSFPICNGVLKWSDVDEEYCLSFVYKGNYTRDLQRLSVTEMNSNDGKFELRDEFGKYFINLNKDEVYVLSVEEDPIAGIGAEGLRLNTDRLMFGSPPNDKSCVTTNGVRLLTEELRAMPVDRLNSKEAKEILELRDLEDILFSC